jgi:DNA invertase Pin-like site-specific DNA recombinase
MAEAVPFVVTAFGLDVEPFMLHIYAAVAQKEREMISQRTKDALKGRVLSGKSLRKLTLETEKAIYDAYKNGVSPAKLAIQYGISRQSTYEAIRRYEKVRLKAATD